MVILIGLSIVVHYHMRVMEHDIQYVLLLTGKYLSVSAVNKGEGITINNVNANMGDDIDLDSTVYY